MSNEIFKTDSQNEVEKENFYDDKGKKKSHEETSKKNFNVIKYYKGGVIRESDTKIETSTLRMQEESNLKKNEKEHKEACDEKNLGKIDNFDAESSENCKLNQSNKNLDSMEEKISKVEVENNFPKSEESEEEFKGFPVTSQETKNQDLVKNLSQKEENELQEMEVFVKAKSEVRLSPNLKRKRKDMEESDLSSHCSSPALSVASQLSMLSFTKRSRTGSPASRGSRKSTVDLSNPKYLLPFEFGWKREVVTRAITSREDGISKDIYYFHPSGKKLRSLREVSEKLTPGLTIENFTFYKEPLGADPSFETIRNARTRGYSPFEPSTPKHTFPSASVKPPSDKPSLEITNSKTVVEKEELLQKDSSKLPPLKNFVKTPKESATKNHPKREKLILKFNKGTPKIALKKTVTSNGERKSPKATIPKMEGPKPHPSAPLGPRRKITPRKKISKNQSSGKEENKKSEKSEGDLEMGMLPPLWSPTAVSNKSSSNESLSWSHLDEEKSSNEEGRLDPCTIRCAKAMGLIPTLQCSVCLCLYHPECCDMSSATSYRQLPKYVCKNCQSNVCEGKSKNLVKHITPAVVTDKNPPIISPKPIHPGSIPSPVGSAVSGSVRMPQIVHPKPPMSKSIFGGSSNWLPPSNSLFRCPSSKNYQTKSDEPSSPPQALISVNDRRFIVVPKNNVLSVASNQSQSPTKSDLLQSTTIITPTPTSTIIQGPPLQNNPFVQPSAHSPGVVLVPFVPGERGSPDNTSQQYLVVDPLPSTTPLSCQADLPTGSETVPLFSKLVEQPLKKSGADGGNEPMQKFMRNICIGYSALLNVFQYLKVQELLRAGRVCRLWRDLANHPSLWRTVRMKNSQVSDWKGFTDSLSRHGTRHLDLCKMLMSVDGAEEMWTAFANHISNVKCLERLDLYQCSIDVAARVMEACPHLLVFNAQMIEIKDPVLYQNLSLESASKMKNLKELRLRSYSLIDSLKNLIELSNTLTTLSLTSVKNLGNCDVHYIGRLQNLEALELGDCSDLPESFPTDVIAKLITLKRIRMEQKPWNCSTNEMLYQMSKLKELVQLELINFDVGPGFDKALASCSNIKRLLLVPIYMKQSATTNNIILSGTFKLWNSLTHFVWVVTMELLKVTKLFVDLSEGKVTKKGGVNSVPVLNPVPVPPVKLIEKNCDLQKQQDEDETSSKNQSPITVIPIDDLFQMLTEGLPNTKVKLLKVPYLNTWRQSITDGGSL